jgi:hypothetical protein
MFELMLAETFVNAAILCGVLFLVAKHEADFSFSKVAMVAAAIQLVAFLTQVFLFDKIGWFTLAFSFVFALLLVKRFCWLSVKKSLLVVAIFCVFQAGTKLGFASIAAYFAPDPIQPADTELGAVVEMLNAQFGASDDAPAKARRSEQETAGADPWTTARQALKLGGVMLNDEGGYIAIVNDEIVEVGDIVKLEFGRTIYRWKVTTISKHNVDFEPLDTQPK